MASTPTPSPLRASAPGRHDGREVGTFVGHPWGLSLAINGDFHMATDTLCVGARTVVAVPTELTSTHSAQHLGVQGDRTRPRRGWGRGPGPGRGAAAGPRGRGRAGGCARAKGCAGPGAAAGPRGRGRAGGCARAKGCAGPGLDRPRAGSRQRPLTNERAPPAPRPPAVHRRRQRLVRTNGQPAPDRSRTPAAVVRAQPQLT
jgi:hypothetical protein